MSDMRLIVAGAGGRMGRTLVKAISETPGLVLAGATEGEGSTLLGQDSGVLAGLPPNRVPITSEVRPGTMAADGIIDFTIPAATVKLAALACYRSPEYQDAAQFLKRGCEVDLVIIPGYDGAQP